MHFTASSLVRRVFAVHPLLLDGALALTLVVGTWLWEAFEPGRGRPGDALSMALTLLVNAPLALRRMAPVAVLMASVGTSLVYHALGYHLGLNSIGPLVALYSVAAHRSWVWCAIGAALVVTEWTYASSQQPGIAVWSATAQSLVVGAWAVGAGTSVRLLSERTGQLADLAAQLHREQDAAAHRAVTRERVRIARELHDVVAHHMSVISVQAGLGRYVALTDPTTAHATLGVIADTSHEALTEMRRMLSILRIEAHDDDEGLYATTPGLLGLDPLVERMRGAGLATEVTVEGRARPLPPGLDLCAYRIVQESLTNVLKHATPGRVDIHIGYGANTLTLRVSNDGTTADGHHPGPAGHGLIGMTERVRLYQGSITAGPLPQGGFEVLATFPLSSPAEDDRPP
ncbi:two-component sensor histidine kinase [Nonomuraea sp. WAC 01424]|uniref:sensor histidine kinase n=1 Tax=Nonomuraea sp. WAC 01424 TaxID=2203200 RepID=UPI000F7988FC|nr:histidine kinase [Nonomuraea sp. WAC 01424]RSN04975.1 two-component sensor histidine kinase [Nonomuraea sp. WAC 01424]